jgi:hypothetical protein
MLPLALLSQNAALVVFELLNYALLFGTMWLLREVLWRERGNSDPPVVQGDSPWRRFLLEPNTGLMLAAIVCFRFIQSNMRHVNANMYVAFALALGLYWIQRNGKPLVKFAGGAAIAWATAIKVTPALFGLYLLWTRRVWGMVGGAVGLVFFLFLLPAMRFGVADTVKMLENYKSHISAAETGEGSDEDPIGHPGGAEQKQLEGGMSVRGTWMRYLTPKAMQFEWAKDDIRFYYINFVDLPESTARAICHVGEALILLLTIALTARHFARTDPGALALSWGLVALTMVLISPLTRKAHLCVADPRRGDDRADTAGRILSVVHDHPSRLAAIFCRARCSRWSCLGNRATGCRGGAGSGSAAILRANAGGVSAGRWKGRGVSLVSLPARARVSFLPRPLRACFCGIEDIFQLRWRRARQSPSGACAYMGTSPLET